MLHTYQDGLQLINGLVGNGESVYFSDFVTDMQSGLSMNHTAMHYSGNNTSAIFVHFQRNALETKTNTIIK